MAASTHAHKEFPVNLELSMSLSEPGSDRMWGRKLSPQENLYLEVTQVYHRGAPRDARHTDACDTASFSLALAL